MVLNPKTGGGESHNWNYSNPQNPGYSLSLTGTVVGIQEVQATKFGENGQPTSAGKTWPDGNPIMNIRLIICGPNGGYRTWTFQPAGKAARNGEKPSVHLDLFALTGNTDMKNLIGKTIKISTQAPPEGFSYGRGNPRPWNVQLVEEGPYQLSTQLDPIYLLPQVFSNQGVSGGQVVQQQPVQQQPTPQPIQQPTINSVEQQLDPYETVLATPEDACPF